MADRGDVWRNSNPKKCISTKQNLDPGYVLLQARREALHKANNYNKVSVTSGNRLEWNDRTTGPIKSDDTEDELSDEISWGQISFQRTQNMEVDNAKIRSQNTSPFTSPAPSDFHLTSFFVNHYVVLLYTLFMFLPTVSLFSVFSFLCSSSLFHYSFYFGF
jgi:hypothetical protein